MSSNLIKIMWTTSAVFATLALCLMLMATSNRISCQPQAIYKIPKAENVNIVLEFPKIEEKSGYIFQVDGRWYLIYATEDGRIEIQKIAIPHDSWMETSDVLKD